VRNELSGRVGILGYGISYVTLHTVNLEQPVSQRVHACIFTQQIIILQKADNVLKQYCDQHSIKDNPDIMTYDHPHREKSGRVVLQSR